MNYSIFISTLALAVTCVSCVALSGSSSTYDIGNEKALEVQLAFDLDPNADTLEGSLGQQLRKPRRYVLNEMHVLCMVAEKPATGLVASNHTNQILRQTSLPVCFSLAVFGTNVVVTIANESVRTVRFRTQYLPVVIPYRYGFSKSGGLYIDGEAHVTYGLPIGDARLSGGEVRTMSLTQLLRKAMHQGAEFRRCKLKFIVLADDGRYTVVNTSWCYFPDPKAAMD